MCKGLHAVPVTVAEHVSRHMIDIRRVQTALTRGRTVSVDDIAQARETAEEVLRLLDHNPNVGTQETRQCLDNFLKTTERFHAQQPLVS